MKPKDGDTGASPPVKRVRASAVPIADLTLPSGPTEPIDDMGEAVTLLYGEKKIGKTSLCSMFPDAFFMMFEPGGHGLRITQAEIDNWAYFVKYIRLLKADPTKFRTLVVDTVDMAYQRCFSYVCKKMGVEHPSEGQYGNVWSGIEKEFTDQMTALMQLGRGVIFTSHAEVGKFQTRSGEEYNKLVPSMSRQARAFIAGVVDCTMYYGYYGEKRFLTIQGNDALEAGHRLKERFRTVNGERVHSIAMGNSEEEGYANLLKAFNNQQRDDGNPKTVTGLSEVPAKRMRARR